MSSAIAWLRNDLRLADNPAVVEAANDHQHVIPLFIWAPQDHHPWPPGAAARWWLHHSLNALRQRLVAKGAQLIIRRGNCLRHLTQLINGFGIQHVYWNKVYEPALISRDEKIAETLINMGINIHTNNSSLLLDPKTLTKENGTAYRVFTPFWRAAEKRLLIDAPLAEPKYMPSPDTTIASLTVEELDLLPKIPWDLGLRENWQPGEIGAITRLHAFCDQAVNNYPRSRDNPGTFGTSRLSPHLRFGEISPKQIWWHLEATLATQLGNTNAVNAYRRQLGWREFSYYVMYHYPHTTHQPMDERFANFPWRKEKEIVLSAWRQGLTGIPIIDAGMRELWCCGWMHNRVRMLVASFLTKNCLMHWLDGAKWFWDTLVDADLASNSMGWQWCAGSGVDAAPYFRLFNPVLQGEKFDPDGVYVKRWLPVLSALPKKYIHKPWLAPPDILLAASITLEKDYPTPIVDLQTSRQLALDTYAKIRNAR